MNNFTIIADNLLITFIDFKVIIAVHYTISTTNIHRSI